jgi:four helix bundle protein
MAKYKNLIVRQKANDLALKVCKITEDFPKNETFGIRNQIRRAALSVPTNIVEGYGRRTRADLSRFLDIARGSLAEAEYLLSFSNELGYIKDGVHETETLIDEVGKPLWSFQRRL